MAQVMDSGYGNRILSQKCWRLLHKAIRQLSEQSMESEDRLEWVHASTLGTGIQQGVFLRCFLCS